jgi:hypothetical protein
VGVKVAVGTGLCKVADPASGKVDRMVRTARAARIVIQVRNSNLWFIGFPFDYGPENL